MPQRFEQFLVGEDARRDAHAGTSVNGYLPYVLIYLLKRKLSHP